MQRAHRAALIELNAAVLLFGFAGLFGKWVAAGPAVIALGRTAFSAVAILIALELFGLGAGFRTPRSLAVLVSSGVVLAAHWVAFFHAIQISTVAMGLVGFATFPVFVTFLEPLVAGYRLRRIDVLSAAIVFAGMVLVAPAISLADAGTLGLLWGVVSALLFAVLTLLNGRLVAEHAPLVVVFYQHATAALVLIPVVAGSAMPAGPEVVWPLLLLGVVCTALPQILFIRSLAVVRAQLASVVTALEPVHAIVLAALLLGEIPAPKTLAGGAIVLGGVSLAMRAHAIPAAASCWRSRAREAG